MSPIEIIHQHLSEAVEDGGYITPEVAAEMLKLLDAELEGTVGVSNEASESQEKDELHSTEEAAYDAFMLCSASKPSAYTALVSFMNRLPTLAPELRQAIKRLSVVMDSAKVLCGVGAVPEVFVTVPLSPGLVSWVRLRDAASLLED